MLSIELVEYFDLKKMRMEGRKIREIMVERIRNEVLNVSVLKRKKIGEYELDEIPYGSYLCFVYRIDEEGNIRKKETKYERVKRRV